MYSIGENFVKRGRVPSIRKGLTSRPALGFLQRMRPNRTLAVIVDATSQNCTPRPMIASTPSLLSFKSSSWLLPGPISARSTTKLTGILTGKSHNKYLCREFPFLQGYFTRWVGRAGIL